MHAQSVCMEETLRCRAVGERAILVRLTQLVCAVSGCWWSQRGVEWYGRNDTRLCSVWNCATVLLSQRYVRGPPCIGQWVLSVSADSPQQNRWVLARSVPQNRAVRSYTACASHFLDPSWSSFSFPIV